MCMGRWTFQSSLGSSRPTTKRAGWLQAVAAVWLLCRTRAFMTTVKLHCSTCVCSSSRASTAVAEAWEEPYTRLQFTHPAP